MQGWNAGIYSETGIQGAECRRRQQLPPLTLTVVRQIVYPATESGLPGRRFTFNYNSDTTETATTQNVLWACGEPTETYTRTASRGLGALSQMVTPSGAEVDYTYTRAGVHDFIGTAGLLNADYIARETLTTKELHHDGLTETWQYDIPNLSTQSKVTVFQDSNYCGFASKVFFSRPRSGLKENSPALQRWVMREVPWSP